MSKLLSYYRFVDTEATLRLEQQKDKTLVLVATSPEAEVRINVPSGLLARLAKWEEAA